MRSLIGLQNSQPALVTSSPSVQADLDRGGIHRRINLTTSRSRTLRHPGFDLEATLYDRDQYYKLLLDVNEPGSEESLISMDRSNSTPQCRRPNDD